MGWVLEDAMHFVRDLQKHIEVSGFHVGLLGSVLHKGISLKDIDVVIFPLNTERNDSAVLFDLLNSFGMKLHMSAEDVHLEWKKKGSDDKKLVEIWKWTPLQGGRPKRVDLFFMK